MDYISHRYWEYINIILTAVLSTNRQNLLDNRVVEAFFAKNEKIIFSYFVLLRNIDPIFVYSLYFPQFSD